MSARYGLVVDQTEGRIAITKPVDEPSDYFRRSVKKSILN